MTMDGQQTAPAVVEMSDVAFEWPGAARFTLEIERFTLVRGSRTLLLGPSGSGKSTFLSLLCGVVVPQRGSIRVLGTDITQLGNAARDRFRVEHIGIIFQLFNLLPYGSVIDNVVLPLSFAAGRRQRIVAGGGSDRTEAERLLGALGLDASHWNGPAASLSVGQQQRVAVARALIGAPELIVADEPTSALDKAHQERFLDLLFDQAGRAGATLIMVSHDEAMGRRFDQTLRLGDIVKQSENAEAAA